MLAKAQIRGRQSVCAEQGRLGLRGKQVWLAGWMFALRLDGWMGLVDREGVLLTVIILLLLSWVCWRSWKRCIKTRLGGWSKDVVDIFLIFSALSLSFSYGRSSRVKAGWENAFAFAFACLGPGFRALDRLRLSLLEGP